MVSKRSVNTLVVGGGFGGIAAALRCKALGHNVTLVERLDKLGGRAQVLKIDGYKHDMGPTVITAPFLFQELFSYLMKTSMIIWSLFPFLLGIDLFS